MADTPTDGKWITMPNGAKVFIEKGESLDAAIAKKGNYNLNKSDGKPFTKDGSGIDTAEYKGWTGGVTSAEASALSNWTASGYREMRAHEMGKLAGTLSEKGFPQTTADRLLADQTRNLALMDSLLAKAPDVTAKDIYRGMRTNSDTFAAKTKVGSVITLPARSSFSYDKETSESFADAGEHPVMYHVNRPTVGKDVSAATSMGEGEVIVPKGTRYKIDSTEDFSDGDSAGKHYTLVHLKEI